MLWIQFNPQSPSQRLCWDVETLGGLSPSSKSLIWLDVSLFVCVAALKRACSFICVYSFKAWFLAQVQTSLWGRFVSVEQWKNIISLTVHAVATLPSNKSSIRVMIPYRSDAVDCSVCPPSVRCLLWIALTTASALSSCALGFLRSRCANLRILQRKESKPLYSIRMDVSDALELN